MRIITAVLLGFLASASIAAEEMELKGSDYACGDSRKMNLWDISQRSELIRYDILKKDYCWKTVKGLRVNVLEHIGRFSHVRYVGDRIDFYMYRSDLRVPQKLREEERSVEMLIERRSVRFLKVQNSSIYGVSLIRNMPTASIELDAGGGLLIEFNIRKDKIEEHFNATATDQRGDALQVGGMCKGVVLGLREGDSFSLKVVAIDNVRKTAEFEVSGIWNKCGQSNTLSYRLLPSKFKIEGKNFNELVRPHTQKEMQKTIY